MAADVDPVCSLERGLEGVHTPRMANGSLRSCIIVHNVGMEHRIFLAASVTALILANLIWIGIDTRPPFWDMAGHQSSALRVYRDLDQNGIAALATVPADAGSYPPFYYLVVAFFYAVFGESVNSAQLANIPAMILLALATYGIARSLLPPWPAALAGVLANFFPFMLWLSRESLIEYWLAALLAAALWALIKTENFSGFKYSLIFGVVCGLGMLTKWTFILYIGLPALWAAGKNLKNAVAAGAVTLTMSLYWFWPQRHTLAAFWRQVALAGRNEGDPALLSWQAVVFYVRALEGYQIFLPLFIAFIAGLWLIVVRWNSAWTPVVLTLAGGWLGLLMISNKDPRYSAPLLPVVAVICARPFVRRKAIAALCLLLILQHYLVSFGIPVLPKTVVIAEGTTGPLSWHWNLYTQLYFDLWGKPARENWHIEDILQRVSADARNPVRLGIVPDIPRFDSHAFDFYISLHRYPVTLNRLWIFDEPLLRNNDYVMLSERDQGWLDRFSQDGDRINNYFRSQPNAFQLVESFPLPNGETINLYKCVASPAS